MGKKSSLGVSTKTKTFSTSSRTSLCSDETLTLCSCHRSIRHKLPGPSGNWAHAPSPRSTHAQKCHTLHRRKPSNKWMASTCRRRPNTPWFSRHRLLHDMSPTVSELGECSSVRVWCVTLFVPSVLSCSSSCSFSQSLGFRPLDLDRDLSRLTK